MHWGCREAADVEGMHTERRAAGAPAAPEEGHREAEGVRHVNHKHLQMQALTAFCPVIAGATSCAAPAAAAHAGRPCAGTAQELCGGTAPNADAAGIADAAVAVTGPRSTLAVIGGLVLPPHPAAAAAVAPPPPHPAVAAAQQIEGGLLQKLQQHCLPAAAVAVIAFEGGLAAGGAEEPF